MLLSRTPHPARGRVSATVGAIFGGAQGASLPVGLLGLAAAGIVAVTHTSPDSVPQPALEPVRR